VIDRWLEDAADSLAALGAGNPHFEAELLLAQALGRPRVFLFTHPEYEPDENERRVLDELLGRRLAGEPLQYVLGNAVFRHLTLRVGPGVLIPRAETEVLAGIALEALRARRQEGPTAGKPWVVDVGVGSGAILLALMKEAADLRFHPLGIDASPAALGCTLENAQANGLPRPHLIRGDLLSALSAVDPPTPVLAIVSNPPYVSTAEMRALPPEIREHEPATALHGGKDGLDVIRRLLDESLAFVGRGAFLCFEIGAMQEEAVRHELRLRGLLARASVHRDLAGRPRVVLVEP